MHVIESKCIFNGALTIFKIYLYILIKGEAVLHVVLLSSPVFYLIKQVISPKLNAVSDHRKYTLLSSVCYYGW